MDEDGRRGRRTTAGKRVLRSEAVLDGKNTSASLTSLFVQSQTVRGSRSEERRGKSDVRDASRRSDEC